MADRSVDVRLGLDVTQYTSNAEKAAASTKQVTAEINKQGGAATTALKQTERSAVNVAENVAAGAAAAGPAIEKGVAKAAASASTAATVAGSRLGKNVGSGLAQALRSSLSGTTAGSIAQATSGISGSEGVAIARSLSSVLVPLTGVLGAGALAWKLWANNSAEAAAREKAFAGALKADAGAFGQHTKALVDASLAQAGLSTSLLDANVARKAVVGSTADLAAGQQQLTDRTNVGVGATVGAGRAANVLAAQQLKLHGALDSSAEAFHTQEAAIGSTTTVASAYNSTIQRVVGSLREVQSAVLDAALAQLDASAADRQASADIAALNKAHHATADQLDNVKRSAIDAALKSGDYRGELVKLRDQTAPKSALRVYLNGLIGDLDRAARDRTSTIRLNFINVAQNVGESHGGRDRAATAAAAAAAAAAAPPSYSTTVPHAFGGPIYGPGTSMSDSLLTPTSPGEFVERAAAVTKYGAGIFRALNNGTYQGGLQLTPKAIAGLEKIAASGLRPDNWNISGNDPASIGREVKAIRDMDRMLYGVS